MSFFTKTRQLWAEMDLSLIDLLYFVIYFFLISSVLYNWMINVIFQNPAKLIKVFHLIISDENPNDLSSLKLVSTFIGSSISTMHMYFCLIFLTILLNYKYRKVISKCRQVLTYLVTAIALLYSIVIFIRITQAPNPKNAISHYFINNICMNISPEVLGNFTKENDCLVSLTEVDNHTSSTGPANTPQCFPDGAVRKLVLMYRVMEYLISVTILLLFSVVIYMYASVIWNEYKPTLKVNKFQVQGQMLPKRKEDFKTQNGDYTEKEQIDHYAQFNKIKLPKRVNEDRNSRKIDLNNGYSSATSEYDNVTRNGNYNVYTKGNEYESDFNNDYVSMKDEYKAKSIDHPLDNGIYEEIKLGKFDLHKNDEGSEQTLSIRNQNRALYDEVDNKKYYYHNNNNNDSSATDTDMTDNDAKSVKNKMNLVPIYDDTTTNSETEIESHDEYFRRGHSLYHYRGTDTETGTGTETDNATVISAINRYQKRNF